MSKKRILIFSIIAMVTSMATNPKIIMALRHLKKILTVIVVLIIIIPIVENVNMA
jgi:hypothetical protein